MSTRAKEGAPSAPQAPAPAQAAHDVILDGLVHDIQALGSRCPHLASFDASRDFRSGERVISYDFHTHRAPRGGWRGGVPEPDPDGVWLHIDIHPSDSKAQLHTQPVGLPTWALGNDRLLFIMLEGERTRSCYADVNAAIEKRVGARRSP